MWQSRKPGVVVLATDDPDVLTARSKRETEETLLSRIAIDAVLQELEPMDRDLIYLAYSYRCPTGYRGKWPANPAAIGRFIGMKYLGHPLTGKCVRERHARILVDWRARYQSEGPCGEAQPSRRSAKGRRTTNRRAV